MRCWRGRNWGPAVTVSFISIISSLILSHERTQTVKRTPTQFCLILGQDVEQLNAGAGCKISARWWRRRTLRLLRPSKVTLEKIRRPVPHRCVAPSLSSFSWGFIFAPSAFISHISHRATVFEADDASRVLRQQTIPPRGVV